MAENKKEQTNLFLKLTKIFRDGPVVKRKIKNLNRKISSSSIDVFKKAHSDIYANTLKSYGAFDRTSRYSDFSEMETCVSGDTLIATPDGYITIKELSEKYKQDETFIVYSYDHENKKIVPALGKQARKTVTDMAYKITFDSGKTLIATADHRCMKRDGTYCEVQDLKSGDSMMPFYKKSFFSEKSHEDLESYQFIYTMDKNDSKLNNGWVAEHRLISEWLLQRKLNDNEVVHHIDFVKSNNNPKNLKVMSESDHKKLHAEILNGKKWSEENKEWIENFKSNHSKFMKENNPAFRNDITFELILNICDRDGFNVFKLMKTLDVDYTTIVRRLKTKGFNNFETFAKAYSPDWRNNGWDNRGDKNPRYDKSLTFQNICNAFEKGIKLREIAEKLSTTEIKIRNRIKKNGYQDWQNFSENFCNHKVVSVEEYGIIDLYDLTVDGYKNFATDSIIVHNTPEISSALDVYSEESAASDEHGKVLHIYSDNRKIKELLENLFYEVMNIEFNLSMWVRNVCKYGDFVLFIDVNPEFGVTNVYPIPISEIEREENFDKDNPSAIRFRWTTQGNRILENWQIAHFRLLGNDAFLPYGTSILESARRIWRQLILIEDAMLVYRIIRAPERRVFYIDVGAIPPSEVRNYIEATKNTFKKNSVVDRTNGRVDLRYNAMSLDEDYFLPKRGDSDGTKIDTLAGGQNTAAIEDVQYIQKKLFAALKVPKAYLGYDEGIGSKSLLSQEDIRFSRSVAKIQRTIISELNKIAMIHLYCNGFSDEDLSDFTLKLSNPSSIAQQQKLELIKTKFEIASAAPEGVVDTKWIRKNIIGLTDDEIEEIKVGLLNDKIFTNSLEKKATAESESFGGGGESMGGIGGENIPTEKPEGGEEKGGGESAGDLFAWDKPKGSLLTALSSPDADQDGNLIKFDEVDTVDEDSENFSESDKPKKKSLFPITANQNSKNIFGGRINKSRKITHGRAYNHMPDFASMTGVGSKTRKQDDSNDPYDKKSISSLGDFETFMENIDDNRVVVPPRLSLGMLKTIQGMQQRFGEKNKKSQILTEDTENE